ncbi:MAG TPA: heavy metal sensor histidine kinase, partial [Planctomycetota bacterium]|nr:heavy metal sensor histidine kinase [Planctomycetota bacterium]
WTRESLEAQLEEGLGREGQVLLGQIAEELKISPGGFRPSFAAELARTLEATGSQAQVLAPDGHVLFASDRFPSSPEGYRTRVETLPGGGAGSYTLNLARSGAPIQTLLRELALFLAVFVPISAALVLMLSLIAIRRTFAPIEAVRLQAEQISRSNVSQRIPEIGTTQELRDLVRTFNAMLGRLEKAIQDLDYFAADAAHELRTPLATLRAELETAIQSTRTLEEYEDILVSFQVEVARMSRVVTDLFTLARMDMRQMVLQREPIRLGPLLEDSRETWQPMASLRNIQIEIRGEDAEVLGDPGALRRVFMNLVENAVKYNHDGGRVVLSIERRNGKVQVRVSDTGLGIAAEHLPKLFQRFFRADKARSRESGGAGLGLAICKSFVESHDGTIAVSSTPDQGSTFTVELAAHESLATSTVSAEERRLPGRAS